MGFSVKCYFPTFFSVCCYNGHFYKKILLSVWSVFFRLITLYIITIVYYLMIFDRV